MYHRAIGFLSVGSEPEIRLVPRSPPVHFKFQLPKRIRQIAQLALKTKFQMIMYARKAIANKKKLFEGMFVNTRHVAGYNMTLSFYHRCYPRVEHSPQALLPELHPHDATIVCNALLAERFPDVMAAKSFVEIDNFEDAMAPKAYSVDTGSFPDTSLGFLPKFTKQKYSKILGGVSAYAQRTPHGLLAGISKRNTSPPHLSFDAEESASEVMVMAFVKHACDPEAPWQMFSECPTYIDEAGLRKYAQKLGSDKVSGLLARLDREALSLLCERPADFFQLSNKKDLKVLGTDAHIRERQKTQVIQEQDELFTLYMGCLHDLISARLHAVLADNVRVTFGLSMDDFEAMLNERLLGPSIRRYTLAELQEQAFRAARGKAGGKTAFDRLLSMTVLMCDFSSFDKSQSRICALALIKVLRLLGIPEEYMVMFSATFGDSFSFSRLGKLSFKFGQMMKSGCILTLIGNTITNLVSLCRILGPIIERAQFTHVVGDDSNIYTTEEVEDVYERFNVCSVATNLEATLEIGSFNPNTTLIPPFYCGHYIVFDVISQTLTMVPCPVKKLFKLRSMYAADCEPIPMESRALAHRMDLDRMTRVGVIDTMENYVYRMKRFKNARQLIIALKSICKTTESFNSIYHPVVNAL